MAETRKFDPTDATNDVQKQVREALGETVRPVVMGGIRPLLQLLDQRDMVGAEADQAGRDRPCRRGKA